MPGEHITQGQADEYAIGSLQGNLERAVALHLAECPACRDIVRDSERLAASLALTAPLRQPSRRLRRRVYAAAGISRPGPLRRAVIIGRAAAGVAAVFVAIAAFTGMVTVRGQLDDIRQQNSDLQTQIDSTRGQQVELAALTRKLDDYESTSAELQQAAKDDRDLFVALTSPDTDVADVVSMDKSASSLGRLIWNEDQKKVWFLATLLPRLPAGETYQIWVSSAGRYYTLGTFEPDETGFARYETVVPEGLTTYDTAVVTIERAGGSPARSGDAVFFVYALPRARN
jgi:anti-sigma-K factor RskA